MNQYQIYDAKDCRLFAEYPTYYAKRPIDALKQYLNDINEDIQVEVSADIDVRFGVIPCITENGKIYQLGYKRKTWFRKKRI